MNKEQKEQEAEAPEELPPKEPWTKEDRKRLRALLLRQPEGRKFDEIMREEIRALEKQVIGFASPAGHDVPGSAAQRREQSVYVRGELDRTRFIYNEMLGVDS
jgi:hypothetical protein